MKPLPETVPFFSQWETSDMTLEVLAEGADAALRRDPLWRGSGAETLDEYAVWAANICGMACLKMILATRGEIVPTIELARQCTRYGGYVVNDGSIKGLIYAPFVSFEKTVTYQQTIDDFNRWVPDAALQRKISGENPLALYFGGVSS